MFNKYPYTDMHELNLDWIIRKMKEFNETMDTFTALNSVHWAGDWSPTEAYSAWSIVRDADGSAYISLKVVPAGVLLTNEEYWALAFDYDTLYQDFISRMDTIEADTQQMIDDANTQLQQMINDANTEMQQVVEEFSDHIDDIEVLQREQAVLDARMDTFASLPDGSTAGDAELQDIRVGADGTTWPSAGDAVRGQVTKLEDDISSLVSGTAIETPTLGDYDGTQFISSTNRAYFYCKIDNIKTISVSNGFQFALGVNNSGIGSAFNIVRAYSEATYNMSNRTERYMIVFCKKPDNSTITQEELDSILTFTLTLNLTDMTNDLSVCERKADTALNIEGLKWLTGSYIYPDGSEAIASDRACTDFIPCLPNVSITYVSENDNNNVYGIAFYDKSYKNIGGFKNNGTLGNAVTVTTPSYTAYLRLSTKVSMLRESYCLFNDHKNSALLAISQKAYDPVVYVNSDTGSDSAGDGRQTNPFKTIQHCIDLGYVNIAISVDHICQESVTASGGSLHLFGAKRAWNSQYPDRVRGKLNGNNTIETALTLTGFQKIILEDIEIYGCTSDGCKIDGCGDVQLVNCSFHDNGNNGIVLDYTNGVIRNCVAYNNGRDGFNMNYYGDTQFFDCSGYNNGDDGISHHQGTTGIINGGEWYGNAKGGVASPANGAIVDILNVYSHNNAYGIWGNADPGSEARTFRVWNSVITDNTNYGIISLRNTALIYNCKIEGNTVGQTTGNVNIL